MKTLLELVGVAAIVAGIAFIFWPAALIVGGLFLVVGANTPSKPAGDA